MINWKILNRMWTILTIIIVLGLVGFFSFGVFANLYYVQELNMALSVIISSLLFLVIGAGFTKIIKIW